MRLNWSIGIEVRTVVLSPWVGRVIDWKKPRGKFLGQWTHSVSRLGLWITWAYAFVKTHPTACFISVYFTLSNHTSIKKENDNKEILGRQQKIWIEVLIRRLAGYVTFHLTTRPSACSDSSVKKKKKIRAKGSLKKKDNFRKTTILLRTLFLPPYTNWGQTWKTNILLQ